MMFTTPSSGEIGRARLPQCRSFLNVPCEPSVKKGRGRNTRSTRNLILSCASCASCVPSHFPLPEHSKIVGMSKTEPYVEQDHTPNPLKFAMPHGAIDAHMHVIGPF